MGSATRSSRSLFHVHPLLPKLLFIFCWLGSFVTILGARRDSAAVDLAAFLALFATPFFIVLICLYGVEDALVTFLALAAIDLRTRKARTVAPVVLLAAAALTKVYPLALLPFLATDRGRIDVRFIILFLAAMSLGILFTVALWGLPFLHIVDIAAVRDGKMLSIFWFLLDSRFSPLAHTPSARLLSDWNFAVVIVVMASLYGLHFFGRLRALAGTVLASIGLLAAYKVGNPPYFVCPATLLIYFLAVDRATYDGQSKYALVAAAAFYLLVLNVFEFWYYLTDGSFQYPQVRAFVGLPCLVATLFLMGQIFIWERRAHGIRR